MWVLAYECRHIQPRQLLQKKVHHRHHLFQRDHARLHPAVALQRGAGVVTVVVSGRHPSAWHGKAGLNSAAQHAAQHAAHHLARAAVAQAPLRSGKRQQQRWRRWHAPEPLGRQSFGSAPRLDWPQIRACAAVRAGEARQVNESGGEYSSPARHRLTGAAKEQQHPQGPLLALVCLACRPVALLHTAVDQQASSAARTRS